MRSISTSQPFDLIDFFLDLKALQIVKLGLMALEFREEPELGLGAAPLVIGG